MKHAAKTPRFVWISLRPLKEKTNQELGHAIHQALEGKGYVLSLVSDYRVNPKLWLAYFSSAIVQSNPITAIATRQIHCFPAGTRFACLQFRENRFCGRRRRMCGLFVH